MLSKVEDVIAAIGKNDEAQKFKIGQPIFENLSERDNHYFLKGSARGAERMRAEILTRFDAYVWASEVDKSLVFKEIRNLIKNAEVNDVAE